MKQTTPESKSSKNCGRGNSCWAYHLKNGKIVAEVSSANGSKYSWLYEKNKSEPVFAKSTIPYYSYDKKRLGTIYIVEKTGDYRAGYNIECNEPACTHQSNDGLDFNGSLDFVTDEKTGHQIMYKNNQIITPLTKSDSVFIQKLNPKLNLYDK